MSTVFKQVLLLPNTTKQIDPVLLKNLVLRMCDAGCSVLSVEECRPLLAETVEHVSFMDESAAFKSADVIFVLGGDGSIIRAAHRSVGTCTPIVGINCGRLGYLAEIEIGELELVDLVLSGAGIIEERVMLNVEVQRRDTLLSFAAPALNDAVLTNGPIPRILRFDLYCDGEPVQHCFADGMIFATPTGSTAYSRAAGGSILDPRLDCICATPICPQPINNLPVVFSGASVLEIRNLMGGGNCMYLSEDGCECLEIQDGDIIRITHAQYRIPLIRVKKGGSLNALSRKLS